MSFITWTINQSFRKVHSKTTPTNIENVRYGYWYDSQLIGLGHSSTLKIQIELEKTLKRFNIYCKYSTKLTSLVFNWNMQKSMKKAEICKCIFNLSMHIIHSLLTTFHTFRVHQYTFYNEKYIRKIFFKLRWLICCNKFIFLSHY